jgi:hypothetical protein
MGVRPEPGQARPPSWPTWLISQARCDLNVRSSPE